MCQCYDNKNKIKTLQTNTRKTINSLETNPRTRPRSVEVTIPEMFVKRRLVRFRKPFAEKDRPLPKPISTSAHPSGEVILLKETLTEPEPDPLCVDS